jgi:hypothetical protein
MDSVGDQPHGLGLPHSEIRESTSARLSSRLFAACHVLHRLSVPRHPPNALIMLDPDANQFTRHTQGQTPQENTTNRLAKNTITRKNPWISQSRSPGQTKPTALTGPRFTQIHNVKQQTVALRPINSRDHSQPNRCHIPDQIPNTLLVEVNGIEPMTSCLQSRRSTN